MAYVTTAEVAEALGLADDDDTRNAQIDMAIAAAEAMVNEHCGRKFDLDATATARVYPGDGNSLLIVDDIGSFAGSVVETGHRGSSTWTPTTDYEVSPLNAIAKGRPVTGLDALSSWGGCNARVRVTARWGWPSVPGNVKQATLLQASRLFKRRNSPEGVLGGSEFGLVRVSRVDPDVQALLSPYVLPGF